MKNECSVVRDILPLYLENMVSEETTEAVKEHLENCPECAAEFEAMKVGKKVEKIGNDVQNNIENEVIKSLDNIRERFRKKTFRAATVIAAIMVVIFIAVFVFIQFFPVYRISTIGKYIDMYSYDEIAKVLFIGSEADRREAQSVLRLADKAFNDVRHTRAENEEEYGLLARYATSTDSRPDMAFNEHSLELWSAHLGKDEGMIWVYYSSETFDHDGNTVRGSWRIPSLWIVEKNETGEWVVVKIKEAP